MRKKFFAQLKGVNEVPPVRTKAFGSTKLWLTKKGDLEYILSFNVIKNVTQGHLHLGSKGVNGPVVAFLFNAAPINSSNGVISVNHGVVTGVISNKDLVGPLKGKTIRDLIRLIKKGDIYANVHTVQNPGGEIRGQVHKVY